MTRPRGILTARTEALLVVTSGVFQLPSACRHTYSGAFISQTPSAGPGAAGVVAGSAQRPALRETDLSSQGSASALEDSPRLLRESAACQPVAFPWHERSALIGCRGLPAA